MELITEKQQILVIMKDTIDILDTMSKKIVDNFTDKAKINIFMGRSIVDQIEYDNDVKEYFKLITIKNLMGGLLKDYMNDEDREPNPDDIIINQSEREIDNGIFKQTVLSTKIKLYDHVEFTTNVMYAPKQEKETVNSKSIWSTNAVINKI